MPNIAPLSLFDRDKAKAFNVHYIFTVKFLKNSQGQKHKELLLKKWSSPSFPNVFFFICSAAQTSFRVILHSSRIFSLLNLPTEHWQRHRRKGKNDKGWFSKRLQRRKKWIEYSELLRSWHKVKKDGNTISKPKESLQLLQPWCAIPESDSPSSSLKKSTTLELRRAGSRGMSECRRDMMHSFVFDWTSLPVLHFVRFEKEQKVNF